MSLCFEVMLPTFWTPSLAHTDCQTADVNCTPLLDITVEGTPNQLVQIQTVNIASTQSGCRHAIEGGIDSANLVLLSTTVKRCARPPLARTNSSSSACCARALGSLWVVTKRTLISLGKAGEKVGFLLTCWAHFQYGSNTTATWGRVLGLLEIEELVGVDPELVDVAVGGVRRGAHQLDPSPNAENLCGKTNTTRQ
jgi:hypothetical protein